jgi:hypothetical protein
MSNRKWIFRIAAALLAMVVGLSAYAAGNDNLLTSNQNSNLLTSSAAPS